MTRPPLGLRLTHALARLLLRAYPGAFRRRWASAFIEVAGHRWTREVEASGHSARATVRAGILLCADTLGAAPGSWRAGSRAPDPSAGDPQRLREQAMSSITGSLVDLRLALRLMARKPVTAFLAAATLALGIGVSTAAFGALDRIVLNPLPFENGHRMRYLALEHRTLGWQITPDAEIVQAWRESAATVERIETYRDVNAVLVGDGPATRLAVTQISIGFAPMLGVRPLLGRMLVEADAAPDAPPVVMLHETYWRRELGADPGVIGRVLRLGDRPTTVVGVWPAAARFHYMRIGDLIRTVPRDQEFSRGGWTAVVALVRPGTPDEVVVQELDGLSAGIGERSETFRVGVNPPTGFLSDTYVQGLWLVFAAAVLLLIVAVINAANLLLGRATTRNVELGVRLALGGSQARILRLFLAESLVLTLAGIAAGFGVATLTAEAYAMWEPRGLVADRGAWLDARTMTFGAAAAVVAMALGTLAPAWRARTTSVRAVLAAGGSRATDASSRLRAALIGAQAALAVLLVAGAGLTGRSFQRLAAVDPGFDVDRLAMVSVGAPARRYPTPEAREAFIQQVRESIDALPQVERLTVTGAPPFQTSRGAGVPVFDGDPEPADASSIEVATQSIDSNYFAVFGTPLVAGRLFEPSETGAVIINESFARAHGGNVLGRRLRFGRRDGSSTYAVVGIARDVTSGGLTEDPATKPQLYFPRRESPGTFARFILRVQGDPAAVIDDVRARVAAIDSTVPLSEASTVRELFDRQTAGHRFLAYLLGGLALFGVVFAVSGVYGVVSLDATRRTREVGVRLALGATTRQVVGRLIGRGLRPVAVGSAVGVTAVVLVGPMIEDLLYRVPARDPWSAAAGVGLVIATAALGSTLPARRASRVDPAMTLRAE